jgi:hypothetical protein
MLNEGFRSEACLPDRQASCILLSFEIQDSSLCRAKARNDITLSFGYVSRRVIAFQLSGNFFETLNDMYPRRIGCFSN